MHMNSSGFPKRQFVILAIVCGLLVVLALVIGMMTKKGSTDSPAYVVDEPTSIIR